MGAFIIMKKFSILMLVAVFAAFTAPAFAMTNPFMDVPMNHWAYDAIGQLAAHGILAGYPDGTYKGQQQTTRYELASSLARALAVVDMTKASKQDVEMMKRLVVEFRDELEALGVRVDELDERVSILEDRLGGWHIHGMFWFDIDWHDAPKDDQNGTSQGSTELHYARLFFERRFGEAEEMRFVARLRQERAAGNITQLDRFFVEMPFFFDSTLTVGRFLVCYEGDYDPWYSWVRNTADSGSLGFVEMPMTGTVRKDGLELKKNFGLGTVRGYITKTSYTKVMGAWNAWEFSGVGDFQFTEKLGFDIGVTAFLGDNNEVVTLYDEDGEVTTVRNDAVTLDGSAFNHSWTVYGGLRFDWNENISLRGAFYHQDNDYEMTERAEGNVYKWVNAREGHDDPNHWRVILAIAQPALTFSSVWLEYGQYDEGFSAMRYSGNGGFLFGGPDNRGAAGGYGILPGFTTTPTDIKYWRVLLAQQWNETWGTHIFYYGYTFDNYKGDNEDAKMSEIGLGVRYRLNPSTVMGLNYEHIDNDDYLDNGNDKDNVLKFRTEVYF